MSSQPNWIAGDRKTPDDAVLLRRLSELGRKTLAPMLNLMFGNCEKAVVELAGDAAGSFDEQRFLDFQHQLASKKNAVMAEFFARLTAAFVRLEQAQSVDADVDDDALELVSQEQIEKQLLVAGGVARVRSEWCNALSHLNQRMRVIAPSAFTEQENPLDPGRIAQAFLEACQQLDADMNLLKLVCRQFDLQVLAHLDDFYRNSNQILIDARVLPELASLGKRAKKRKPAASRSDSNSTPGQLRDHGASQGAGASGAGVAGTVAGAGSGADIHEISSLLQRLRGSATPFTLGGATHGGSTGGQNASSAAGSQSLSGSQLVTLISGVQGEVMQAGGSESRSLDIRSVIDSITAQQGDFSLGEADGDVLNVVAMIFEAIANDRNLPPEFQALVLRLQLPVLKIALLDRAFFSDRKHPARQFVNALARAGSGWDAHGCETQDSLLEQISDLVDELSADPATDAQSFASALTTLTQCLEHAEQRAVKLERRTSEKAVAEARLHAARDAVHAVMQQRLEGSELPVAILDFLAQDWQRVLQLFYLRKGMDSVEWTDAVRVIDELVQSVSVPEDDLARIEVERGLPQFYTRLENALAQTQCHSEEARARVEIIRDMHRKLLVPPAGRTSAQVVPIERARIQSPPMIAPRVNPDPDPQPEPPPEALMFESLQRVDEMPIGTWFEYEDSKSRATRRCKLSACIEETRTFLFSDRLGMPAREKTRKVFAYELQTDKLRPIEDGPLLERTLDHIAGMLREQAGAA